MASEAETDEPQFNKTFNAAPGEAVALSPLVRRVLANNTGPFTFRGTCSYIIGRGQVAILDPGPEDVAHVDALQNAVRGETVTHILVSHTHRDHSPAARALSEATGAPIVGCAPYFPKSGVAEPGLDASHDREHAPAHIMRTGDVIAGPGWTLEALETPGHAANHLCFAMHEEKALFSADHVMAWSTSIVAPPDGSMGDYMRSLDLLRGRDDTIYWPGHGGPVLEPQRFVRGLAAHRRQRETAILKRLAEGDRTIQQMVPVMYAGVPQALHGAAALSVLSHLDDLMQRHLVRSDSGPVLTAQYWLA
ncbi:MAG: MBL fold metallo-hydrolase [Beijerinckiaceae bacterium]